MVRRLDSKLVNLLHLECDLVICLVLAHASSKLEHTGRLKLVAGARIRLYILAPFE